MKKYLTPQLYKELQNKKTTNGYTLNEIIACGISCGYLVPRMMGCMAGDYDCYYKFGSLFDPIIRDYHNFGPFDKHNTDLNPGHLRKVKNMDPNAKYVLSTRIRVARSISGFSFPAGMSRGERREVESITKKCFKKLNEDLGGMYVALNDMDNEENDDLIQRHILFDNPDEWGITCGLGKDWPDARGIYVNVETLDDHPDFVVWVNEEDHLRIMVVKKGGDIFEVFDKLVRGISTIERTLAEQGHEFLHDERLGYMTSCPTNLGTGLRASMHVKLMHLGRLEGFDEMCERMQLEVRGKHGETDKKNSGIYDVSNSVRLGPSEVELIQTMIDGVRHLIKLEKALENGETINCADWPNDDMKIFGF